MIFRCLIITAFIFSMLTSMASGNDKMIIASQEGASPMAANTLSALVYTMTTGAELIEHQLVMTQDNQLIVFNSITLDGQTNAAALFPDRTREDGKMYVIDFTLEEIKRLSITGNSLEMTPDYHIPSFQDVLLLHGQLEKKLGRQTGLYLEIKSPWFHTSEGRDISDTTLRLLKQNGFTGKDDKKIFIQSYDPEELQRIHDYLAPTMEMEPKLVLLLGDDEGTETKRKEGNNWVSYDYGWLYTRLGLRVISSYTDALGINSTLLLNPADTPIQGNYIPAAKGLGIQIHAKGLEQPVAANSSATPFDDTLTQIFTQVEAEAITTVNWVEAAAYLKNNPQNSVETAEENTTEAEVNPLNPVELTPQLPAQVRDTATQF